MGTQVAEVGTGTAARVREAEVQGALGELIAGIRWQAVNRRTDSIRQITTGQRTWAGNRTTP